MGLTRLQLTISELDSASRRMDKIIQSEQEHNDFLCRSSDGCWDYPDANEKYEMYLDAMSNSNNRLEKLKTAKEGIVMALAVLKQFKD